MIGRAPRLPLTLSLLKWTFCYLLDQLVLEAQTVILDCANVISGSVDCIQDWASGVSLSLNKNVAIL